MRDVPSRSSARLRTLARADGESVARWRQQDDLDRARRRRVGRRLCHPACRLRAVEDRRGRGGAHSGHDPRFRGGFAMKYVDEFRDGELARGMARNLAALAQADRDYRFMEFCGGHTHAISRYGLEDLLPANVRMIHGPGCPVCVLPIGRIEAAIALARNPKVTLCTY